MQKSLAPMVVQGGVLPEAMVSLVALQRGGMLVSTGAGLDVH